jgi:gluconokinase
MAEKLPRSPYDAVKGLVYFARMLDKIRLHEAGVLPKDYLEHLGHGFDERCVNFLHVKYEDVRKLVLAGEKDESILEWCHKHGRKPTEEEVEIWSGFMQKRGWRDESSERLALRVKEAGLEKRGKGVATMFDFIDLDEGRTPPDFKK